MFFDIATNAIDLPALVRENRRTQRIDHFEREIVDSNSKWKKTHADVIKQAYLYLPEVQSKLEQDPHVRDRLLS